MKKMPPSERIRKERDELLVKEQTRCIRHFICSTDIM